MDIEGKVSVSLLITTQDEELNIRDCLASVISWADQVLVLDSGSTDRTLELCRTYGAEVFSHGPYEGAAKQRNWALDHLQFKHPWILLLDADERVSPALAKEIAEVVARDGDGKVGFWINRRFIFYGKWIRHSGWYPSWNIRLFKRGKARHELRAVGPHIHLEGEAGRLKHDLIHEDIRDLSFWIAKHNRYSNWEAYEYVRRLARDRQVSLGGSAPFQVKIKRWIKESIWPNLPGRAIVLFVYLYLFRLGFLDGKHGLRFCVMHAVFEHLNVMKQWELQNYKMGAPEGGISAPRYFDPHAVYGIKSIQ